MSPVQSNPPGKQIGVRIALALAGAVLLGALSVVLWFVIGFALIEALFGSEGLMLGYIQIALLPVGAAIGMVVGALTGLLGSPRRVLVRWLVATIVIGLAGGVVNIGLLLAL